MAKTISINNSKGGVAKTTTTLTLAQILAYAGYKVLVMDLDPQANTTKVLCPAYQEQGLIYKHLFCEKQFSKRSVEEFIVETTNENISLFPAEKQLEQLVYDIYEASKSAIVGQIFRKNMEFIKNDYDYILIDNSPYNTNLITCSLFIIDDIITPIENDNFSYDGIINFTKEIQSWNRQYSLNVNFKGVFMVKVENRTVLYKQMFDNYKEALKESFIPISIRKTESIKQSNTMYVGILDYDKKCNAVQDYIELAKYLELIDDSHMKTLMNFINKKN